MCPLLTPLCPAVSRDRMSGGIIPPHGHPGQYRTLVHLPHHHLGSIYRPDDSLGCILSLELDLSDFHQGTSIQ